MSEDVRNKPDFLDCVQVTNVRMLAEEVARRLHRFHFQHCMQDSGCLITFGDHGPRGEDPYVIPYAPFSRSRVFTGTRQNGSFNHHSQWTKFRGRYFLAWSNGIINEEAGGQRILISSSQDANQWSEPVCVAGDRSDDTVAHNCLAIKATEDKLYIVDKKEDTTVDAKSPGMRRIEPNSERLSVHASDDGKSWEKVFDFADDLRWAFEGSRPTADGHYLCIATLKSGPAFLRWPGENICEHPEIIPVKQPEGAVFAYGEGSWYQADDGNIVAFWRDEGQSCRLWVNYSTDGGRTFSVPALSNIPDSMSRVYAGRLQDGRFFLCNNAFPTLLNRRYLTLMLSDNGYVFNKVYLLIDDPTSQRVRGLLKADGYQYPCCLVDDDKLLVGYSVNKEDIECGIVDLKSLAE